MKAPIFIGYTRSFLFGILPTLLIAIDIALGVFADPGLAPPIASLIAWVFGLDVAATEAWMQRMAPLFALIIAQQRAHSTRPYSIDPRAT